MIEIAVAVLSFWTYCAVMSAAAKSERAWVTLAPVHAASVAVFVALFCWCAASIVPRMPPLMGVPFVALTGILGVLVGLRWWGFLVGEYIERTHAAAIGIDSMKVQKSYDQASRAEKEQRWAEAIRMYLDEAAADPADAEALRRAGEACVGAGQVEEGVGHLRAALARLEGAEDRATQSFRIAELLARDLRRPDEARELIMKVATEMQGTKYEEFARERMRSLPVT